MPAAIIPAIAAVGGAAISASASKSAANTQADAANNAAQTQWNMFKTVNDQQAPYRAAGQAGLTKLSDLLGLNIPQTASSSAPQETEDQIRQRLTPQFTSSATPNPGDPGYAAYVNAMVNGQTQPSSIDQTGLNSAVHAELQKQGVQTTPQSTATSPEFGSLMHTFNAGDLKTNLSPSYDFMLKQGLGSVNNQNTVTGGLVGGNALKGINDYAQNYASTGYQQAYDNFNTNQTNIFNRLAGIAGIGQTANAQTAQAGMTTAGNVGSAQLAGGAARAAGYTGMGNAISGGLNNASSWYSLGNMLNPSETMSNAPGNAASYTDFRN